MAKFTCRPVRTGSKPGPKTVRVKPHGASPAPSELGHVSRFVTFLA
jgi:hypothetical protein